MKNSRRYSAILAVIAVAACSDGPTGPGGGLGRYQPLAVCSGGQAAGHSCGGVDLLSQVSRTELEAGSNASLLNDLWGWTDEQTGGHYVIVGRQDGVDFVDVSDPLAPVPLGRLASAAGVSTWRDVKVYADHAYVVADGLPGHGVQIFDLRRLRGATSFTEFTEDGHYDGVSSVHNIAINEASGYAYAVGSNSGGETCGGGLHMIDLSTPTHPVFAGCFAAAGTGRAKTGYTHDVQCVIYDGPDAAYAGREICVASNETDIVIVDVTSKGTPAELSSATYPNLGYTHQGWLSEDHRYFFQNDELDELGGLVPQSRMLVWDLTDLDDPVLADEYFGPTSAIDHNLYVRGDLIYYSNYTFGLRVVDVRNPRNPVERGHFDTHPANDDGGFSGSWSNYPFFDDGVIAVSSSHDGLFLLQLQP